MKKFSNHETPFWLSSGGRSCLPKPMSGHLHPMQSCGCPLCWLAGLWENS